MPDPTSQPSPDPTQLHASSPGAVFVSPQFIVVMICLLAAIAGFFLGRVSWDQFVTFVPIIAGSFLITTATSESVRHLALGRVLVAQASASAPSSEPSSSAPLAVTNVTNAAPPTK